MKHIISLSGGIGSYETLKRVLQSNPKEDVQAVFCDTLMEDGDLYRFLDDIENKLGIKIIRLATGKDPWQLCFENKFLFNSRVALCSRVLKSALFRTWLNANYPNPTTAILYLGIDFTESHRKEAIIKNYLPYKVKFPLCDKPYLLKSEMLEDLKKDRIKIPRLYELGFNHNNCSGACFKAGIGSWRNLLEKDPNTYRKMEDKEETFRQFFNKDVSILKRKSKTFTLKELRVIVETQPKQLSLFEDEEIGGCGCFAEMEEPNKPERRKK